jgi:hypothetical protein
MLKKSPFLISFCFIDLTQSIKKRGAVIVWLFDLPLPMQSVPITTDVVSLNLDQGEVYNIMC